MIVKDMLQREVEISKELRIISLVPSQTELLYDLGLENEVIGITNYCIHPKKWRTSKTTIGGTKNINLQKIRDLKPNLIIANKEENLKADILNLEKDFPVWISDVNDFDTALKMIEAISEFTYKTEEGQKIINEIKRNFSLINIYKEKNAIYLIWKDPYMTIGSDTFINGMMLKAGFNNIFNTENRYPEVGIEKMKEIAPEYLLLSSEPYPFKEKHVIELKKELPNTKILTVDGEMFSWYGSRMIKAAKYFKELF